MVKRFFLFVMVVALSAAFAFAQDAKLTMPVKATPPDDGKQMYVSYCATCHGLDGRGNGPTSQALKTPPADLAMLAKNNNGTYPAIHVVAVIRFGVDYPSHGSKTMPVWGPALRNLDHSMSGNSGETLRITNLVNYVESLQVK